MRNAHGIEIETFEKFGGSAFSFVMIVLKRKGGAVLWKKPKHQQKLSEQCYYLHTKRVACKFDSPGAWR